MNIFNILQIIFLASIFILLFILSLFNVYRGIQGC